MNDKEVHTTDNELHDLITPTCREQDDRYGTTRPLDDIYSKPHQRPVHGYDGWEGHWPGDGSGMDDFADYNQNENGWGNW